METLFTRLSINANGRTVKEIENELRYEFPNMPSLNVSNGGEKILISWKARKYKKEQVENYLNNL